jgi:hypothetical protein
MAVVRPLAPRARCGKVPAQLVDAADALRRDERVGSVAAAALRAVGVGWGLTRVDMRITPSGPMVLGLTPTMGSRIERALVQLATGTDLWAVAAATAMGSTTLLTEHEYRCALAAQVHVPAARGRTVQQWRPQLDLPEPTFSFVHHLDWDPVPGPGRFRCGCVATGWAFITGHDQEHCLRLLQQIRIQLGATTSDDNPR